MIQYTTVKSYAALTQMLSVTPVVLTFVVVEKDEILSQQNSLYMSLPNGVRLILNPPAVAQNGSTDLSSYSTTSQMNTAISTAIANIVNGSPSTLDTLNEIAASLANDPNFSTTILNQLASKTIDLTPTAIKTAAYTAAANELVKTDASNGNVPIALPTAPADKTRVCIKMIAVSSNFNTPFSTGGSDVLNKAGGSTSGTLYVLNQAVTLQYEASTAIWSIISSDVPLSQLDLRYPALNAAYTPKPVLTSRVQDSRITIFASGHGYTTSFGTLSDDTTDFVLGTQSVKLISDGSGVNQVRAAKSSISPTIDFTSGFFKLAIKVDSFSTTKLKGISLYASSDNFVANWQVQNIAESAVVGRSPYGLDGVWAIWTISKTGFANGAGTINWAAINSIRVSFTDEASNPITAHVNLIAKVPQPANGVVSITFDDGWLSNYTKARPTMDKYGFPATIYQIAERAINGTATAMSVAQLQSLVRLSGWEIAAHAYSVTMHNSANAYMDYTDAEVAADMAKIKDWIVSNGFGAQGAEHFAWPQGLFDAAKLEVARRFFSSARTTHKTTVETFPAASNMRLRRFNGASVTNNGAAVTAAIDKCIANKDWLILNYHDVVAGSPSGSDAGIQVTQTDFDTAINYLATTGVRVKTIGDVLATGVV